MLAIVSRLHAHCHGPMHWDVKSTPILLCTKNTTTLKYEHTLTKNEITFGPISILFCTKSLLKAQK